MLTPLKQEALSSDRENPLHSMHGEDVKIRLMSTELVQAVKQDDWVKEYTFLSENHSVSIEEELQ